jgi:hypothetical protein
MSLWKWSQTAASNGTIDGTVRAQEGQAPGTLNDAVRGAMAAIAKYRDDVSGNLVTAGTSTAYTLTTNQVLTTLTDGFKVTVRIDETNGAAATLNVDSLGAKALASVYGTALPAGVLLAGGVYSFVYDATDDKWIVHGYWGDVNVTSSANLTLLRAQALIAVDGTYLNGTGATGSDLAVDKDALEAAHKTAFDLLYAEIDHVHDAATGSVAGFMSAADKTKLDGIASGATVGLGLSEFFGTGVGQMLQLSPTTAATNLSWTRGTEYTSGSANNITLVSGTTSMPGAVSGAKYKPVLTANVLSGAVIPPIVFIRTS